MDSPSAFRRIIRLDLRRYILTTQQAKQTCFAENSVPDEETTMRKTILTLLASAAFAASTMQVAVASERHHIRKAGHTVASEPFRNANNSLPASAPSPWPYSGFSAPAGH
jgi:hypothetical protein